MRGERTVAVIQIEMRHLAFGMHAGIRPSGHMQRAVLAAKFVNRALNRALNCWDSGLLPLPPRSPELNPVENIWHLMRDNWLSNRIFNSYDTIVAHCCDAWNRLIENPWKIMSIAYRQWAHEGNPP